MRFQIGEVVRRHLGSTPARLYRHQLVIILEEDDIFYDCQGWRVIPLRESNLLLESNPFTVKEYMLLKVIWTFTGYTDKPSEYL